MNDLDSLEKTNGRLMDILMEDQWHMDERTGIRSLSREIRVFADSGVAKIIRETEGVLSVLDFSTIGCVYLVDLDPRYDREYVKREIEARIKCRE